MSEIRDFHFVDFFRNVRDKHANILTEMLPEEIIAFYQSGEEPNKHTGRHSHSGPPARGGVRETLAHSNESH